MSRGMANSVGRSETAPIVFDVRRSDLSIQVNFRSHFWSLFHNIPNLYSALLRGLGEFGVTPSTIKSDVADGSLGAYNVNFWMFGFRALVRIRLEQVEIQFNNITQSDVEQMERAFVRLLEALAASNAEFALSSYAVDIGLHGELSGVESKDYLATFVARSPRLPGPYIGSGVVFYFGEDGAATLRTVTADLSGLLPGKLYVRVYCVYKETLDPKGLRAAVEEQMTAAFSSIGLRRETA